VLRNEPKDLHRLLLPDPVRPILGLEVGLGVPVTIEKYDNVSSLKVDAKTSSTSGEKEAKLEGGGEERSDERKFVSYVQPSFAPNFISPCRCLVR
jgi:hypothetical protein